MLLVWNYPEFASEFESNGGRIRKEILQRKSEKKNGKEENRIEEKRIAFRDINVHFRESIRFGVLSDSTAGCAQSLSSYGLRSRLLPLNHK